MDVDSESFRSTAYRVLKQTYATNPAFVIASIFVFVGGAVGLYLLGLTSVRSEMKGDIAELKGDMKGLADKVDTKLSTVSSELRGEMKGLADKVDMKLSTVSSELRGDMKELRTELRGDMRSMNDKMDGIMRILLGKAVALKVPESEVPSLKAAASFLETAGDVGGKIE